jgi:hypothetical protein
MEDPVRKKPRRSGMQLTDRGYKLGHRADASKRHNTSLYCQKGVSHADLDLLRLYNFDVDRALRASSLDLPSKADLVREATSLLRNITQQVHAAAPDEIQRVQPSVMLRA